MSGEGLFWVIAPQGSAPALRTNSYNSARDASASYSPVSTAASSARSGLFSFSVFSKGASPFLCCLILQYLAKACQIGG